MRFRPCIDLHDGRVKQIVGSSLRDDSIEGPATNFVAECSSGEFAAMYMADGLVGGHVIMLGSGNEAAAAEALAAYPGGLQVGGGISPTNAAEWLGKGAQKVILTSWLFPDGEFSEERAAEIESMVGRGRLVIDLSCRWADDGYYIASQRWQRLTSLKLSAEVFALMSRFCDELLIHAVHVEGMRQGIDERLVEILGAECPLQVTYAGGIRGLADLDRVEALSGGRVDATVGSALDIFGGELSYRAVVEWDRARR